MITAKMQRTQRGATATKTEAQNPKLETNSNDRNSNEPNKFKSNTGNLLNKSVRN